jgi:hypothetical protein
MSTDDHSTMSADELWLLHREIVEVLTARLLERKRKLDAQLAILQHPMGRLSSNYDLPRILRFNDVRERPQV